MSKVLIQKLLGVLDSVFKKLSRYDEGSFFAQILSLAVEISLFLEGTRSVLPLSETNQWRWPSLRLVCQCELGSVTSEDQRWNLRLKYLRSTSNELSSRWCAWLAALGMVSTTNSVHFHVAWRKNGDQSSSLSNGVSHVNRESTVRLCLFPIGNHSMDLLFSRKRTEVSNCKAWSRKTLIHSCTIVSCRDYT